MLLETQRNGLWRGYTTRYTEVAVDENLHKQIKSLRIEGISGTTLQGVLE